jgi:hypothetical protein
MKFVLFALGLIAAPGVFAADDLGIQNCSEVDLDFRDVKQTRDFAKGEIRMYLIDKTIGRNTTNGLAVIYRNFCRYINGSFDTDLNEALPLIGLVPNVDRVRLKVFVPEGRGARSAWMTVKIMKSARSEPSAIVAWIR